MMNGKIDQLVGSMVRPIAGSLLVAGALFCFGLMSGHAQTVDASTALTYVTDGNSVTITKCDENASGTLVISSSYNGKPVTAIGFQAFRDCTSLTSVTIPDSVTSIGNSAFRNCSGLTSVTIPDSVTSIGNFAFYLCSSLTSIEVVVGNSEYTSQDGVLFNKNKTTLIVYPGGKQSGHYSIPGSVISIGIYAFWDCSSLTSVTIPDSVTSIGDSAFEGCSGLTSVTIPDSVTSIGRYAFYNCSSLTSVTIPASVTSIGSQAFAGCSSLTSVTIPDSVTSIGGYTFSDCSSLTSVTIPDSVTSIGKKAFAGTKLTEVTILNPNAVIADGAFDSSVNITAAFYSAPLTYLVEGNSITVTDCDENASGSVGNSIQLQWKTGDCHWVSGLPRLH